MELLITLQKKTFQDYYSSKTLRKLSTPWNGTLFKHLECLALALRIFFKLEGELDKAAPFRLTSLFSVWKFLSKKSEKPKI